MNGPVDGGTWVRRQPNPGFPYRIVKSKAVWAIRGGLIVFFAQCIWQVIDSGQFTVLVNS